MAERKRTPEAEDDVLGQMGDEDLDLDVGNEDDDDTNEDADPKEADDKDEDAEDKDQQGDDSEDSSGTQASHQEEKYLTPKVKPDKKGNLVDEKGRIIAPAGPARRFYEDKVRAEKGLANAGATINHQKQVMGQAGQALQYMKDQLMHIKETQDLPKTLGLNNDEYVEFVQLAAKWKTDPVNAIKYLLTRAAQRGIKLDDLGGSGGIDLSVLTNDLTKHIDNKLNPITNRFKQSEDRETQLNQERMELLTLQSEGVPEDMVRVVQAMGQKPEFQGQSTRERWLHLQNYLLRNPQRQQDPQTPARNSRARLNGQQRPGAERRGNVIDDSPVDVDVDFKDIVKSVIADHGLPPDYK